LLLKLCLLSLESQAMDSISGGGVVLTARVELIWQAELQLAQRAMYPSVQYGPDLLQAKICQIAAQPPSILDAELHLLVDLLSASAELTCLAKPKALMKVLAPSSVKRSNGFRHRYQKTPSHPARVG